jgi:cyclic pyranopterin phosphate synthase
MPKLTHIDESNQPTMVDVGHKAVTERTACARTIVRLPTAVLDKLEDGDIKSAKGPVFQTAIIAGTMAVKRTSDLIPFCHPLPIEKCKLTIAVDEAQLVVIDCTVRVHHKTGVEMEALTGASVAALAIYDMCKGLSHDIIIESTQLLEKTGGKRDYKRGS